MVNRCFLVDPEHLFGIAKFRGYHTNWVGCESFKFGGGGVLSERLQIAFKLLQSILTVQIIYCYFFMKGFQLIICTEYLISN